MQSLLVVPVLLVYLLEVHLCLYKNQRLGNIPVHRRTLTFAFPKNLWHGCLGERWELR